MQATLFQNFCHVLGSEFRFAENNIDPSQCFAKPCDAKHRGLESFALPAIRQPPCMNPERQQVASQGLTAGFRKWWKLPLKGLCPVVCFWPTMTPVVSQTNAKLRLKSLQHHEMLSVLA